MSVLVSRTHSARRLMGTQTSVGQAVAPGLSWEAA